MSVINQNGENMPLQWFLSPANKDFPEQLAAICGEITKRNNSSVRIIDPAGFAAFQRILNGVKTLFKDDEEAKITVKYSELKMGYDILVYISDFTAISKIGEIGILQEILNDTPVFGIDPIDNEHIQLDFGTPRVYRILEARNE